jgi:prepilin-type N-terminal cleavage/methylation domain-containing protein
MTPSPRRRRSGFTLLEILIAVVILVMAMTVIVMTFSNISSAWRNGTVAAANLTHADAILDQLVAGLRSAYFKKAAGGDQGAYGFWLENDGSGSDARDSISWVKTGAALVDPDSQEASTLHRIVFTVDDDDRGRACAAVKAWRPFGQPEDFDPEKDTEFFYVSSAVEGFDCEVSTNVDFSGDIEWEEDWEETNRIPLRLHLSLYLKPGESGNEPLKVERLVEIPIAPLSW